MSLLKRLCYRCAAAFCRYSVVVLYDTVGFRQHFSLRTSCNLCVRAAFNVMRWLFEHEALVGCVPQNNIECHQHGYSFFFLKQIRWNSINLPNALGIQNSDTTASMTQCSSRTVWLNSHETHLVHWILMHSLGIPDKARPLAPRQKFQPGFDHYYYHFRPLQCGTSNMHWAIVSVATLQYAQQDQKNPNADPCNKRCRSWERQRERGRASDSEQKRKSTMNIYVEQLWALNNTLLLGELMTSASNSFNEATCYATKRKHAEQTERLR